MRTFLPLGVVALLIAGCATATPTQKGAVTGSAIGAGLGAIIGHQSGETGEGALIGAAAGGLAGALIGDAMASQFCPSCGRDYLSTDGPSCPLCGAALRPKGAPAQTAQQQQSEASLAKFCPTCGRGYGAEANNCSIDGSGLKTRHSS